MNRRGFFQTLATVAAAASLSPHIFIPKFEPVKWKVQSPVYDWRNYKGKWTFKFIDMPPVFDPLILERSGHEYYRLEARWDIEPIT